MLQKVGARKVPIFQPLAALALAARPRLCVDERTEVVVAVERQDGHGQRGLPSLPRLDGARREVKDGTERQNRKVEGR